MRHHDYSSYRAPDGEERLLHVHGPAQWHDESYLVGDRAALEALRDAVDEALATGSGLVIAEAADGEGFALGVVLEEDAERWSELRLPYHGELAQDRRELHETLQPTLSGGDGSLELGLLRWRRVRLERMARLTGWQAGLNKVGLVKLLEERTPLELKEAKEAVDRLLDGAQPAVEVTDGDLDGFLSQAGSLGADVEPLSPAPAAG